MFFLWRNTSASLPWTMLSVYTYNARIMLSSWKMQHSFLLRKKAQKSVNLAFTVVV